MKPEDQILMNELYVLLKYLNMGDDLIFDMNKMSFKIMRIE